MVSLIIGDTGLKYPSLPTNRKVRKWIDMTMRKLGLTESRAGSWLSVDLAIEALMEAVGARSSNGKVHVQVMADAVRVYRKTAFTVVALRVLQDDRDYNSMMTTCIL